MLIDLLHHHLIIIGITDDMNGALCGCAHLTIRREVIRGDRTDAQRVARFRTVGAQSSAPRIASAAERIASFGFAYAIA